MLNGEKKPCRPGEMVILDESKKSAQYVVALGARWSRAGYGKRRCCSRLTRAESRSKRAATIKSAAWSALSGTSC